MLLLKNFGALSNNKSMLKLHFDKTKIEAGCDEAGRGCLAGPVVAASVILPQKFKSTLLNDSKQLSEKNRNELRTIIEYEALSWAVGVVSEKEIDEINILNASFKAMHHAVDKLSVVPELLLIDGNRFKTYKSIPHQCIVKGDAKFMSIAAASILAKTYRDELMEKLHEEYPYYNWIKNKGYPTKAHRDAIRQHGASPYHRMSFQLLPSQLTIDY
jgi:ribonuclease HII